ncbi:GTP binding / GTPase [Reticulomyxa filosa]|uniref:GTP binding / GTPase n=1 Tax=Reticulomyxa filosa TaxID=46433 RepID=X6MML7_RETFI|nr:GTP binding / GTPase [Reticulomyxa filosa]|eukprot:ETO14682.1 GTP binding / GTPase [Reticulomyxa filosa]
MAGKKDQFMPIVNALRLPLKQKEMDIEKNWLQDPKKLMKKIMCVWIPANGTLLDMMVRQLPSPLEAQHYRVTNLYSGPLDTLEAAAVAKCDASGPMSVYVAKMVPFGQRRYAFGRVFSGTIKESENVRILGPDYEHNTKRDLYVKKVGSIGWIGARGYTYKPESIHDCPAGNLCTILDLDNFMLHSGTLTDSDEFYPFRNTSYSTARAAVVQVAIDSKSPADLPRLVQGLKRLSQLEPSARVYVDTSGQHWIYT